MRAVRAGAAVLALLALIVGCEQDVVRFTMLTGGSLEVRDGETHEGTVLVLDGSLVVEPGGAIVGTTVVLGGSLWVGGEVLGDVVAVAGEVTLADGARAGGDVSVAGALLRHPGATIDGSLTEGPAVPRELGDALRRERTGIWETLLQVALAGAGAWFVARFAPRGTRNLADAAAGHPLVAGAVGLLTLVVALALAVVMAFTIVLLPVSLLALAALLAAVVLGWFALGAALGRGFSRALRREWPPTRSAVVGTIAVVGLLAATEPVPLLGATLPIAVTAVGVGAAVLTGFGLRRFVPAAYPDEDERSTG